MEKYKYPSVLTIAGSDSGGGAGIQADLKTISALGCFATTAITAITVQNTLGVTAVHNVPPEIVQGQIKAVMDDIMPSAIKIGLINTVALAVAIAGTLKVYPHVPIVFDPVMVSTSGYHLTANGTIETFRKEIFPLVQLITPNIDEAEILSGIKINTLDDMKIAASHIVKAGCNAVLIKGGHLKEPDLYDFFLDTNGNERVFTSNAINTNNTHGTGCTLSSAITSFIALGNEMIVAIEKASAYMHFAIDFGKDVKTGNGKGPLNHFFDPLKMIKLGITT